MEKRNILWLFLLLAVFCTGTIQAQNTNVAYQDEHVRFTVIADGVFRLEYAPDGAFIDDKSFLAVQRSYPEVDFKAKTKGKWVEISTSKATLRYKKGTGAFTAQNLSIASAKDLRPAFRWKPGDKQKGNLKGTLRTLDRMDGDMFDGQTKVEIPDGLLAVDGWTLIDDSKNFLFDNSEWEWVKVRPDKDGQDWYFMAYGHNYKQALKDYTLFAGKVPLPPRYAFGYWWSRYWAYTDNEIRTLIDNFHMYDIPLDVLVLDMDWHHIAPGKGGWTGWTWNDRLYPDHKQLLKYIKSNDLQITLNLHPADGIAPYEEQYPAMAKDLGIDPASNKTIEWLSSDKRFMTAFFKDILHPMEKEGVDFWWLDWQQWMYDKKVDSLNNTWWINYCFYSDMERNRDVRPMIYHRWGGLGNHRYPIGFSGDTHITWKSLQFQPYFNSTSSNVLYGYWGHDLGGHTSGKVEPEMYTRWMQFGTYSPIMRTHTAKAHETEKEPWAFGQYYLTVLSQTIRQRYELAPYIYTMARKNYDEAISLCRPMYYDYPETAEAYDKMYRNEYMFGDQILVAPVVTPLENGFSRMDVWLPEGSRWYEWCTGTLFDGGQVVNRAFALDEYGVYVKAGSIIPLYTNEVKNLRSNDSEVVVTVFTGGNGTFNFYEDNGNDKHYDTQYAFTPLSSTWDANELTIRIGARKGQYEGMPANRKYSVKVVGEAVPERVTVDGKDTGFQFDGDHMELTVAIAETDCAKEKVVTLHYPANRVFVADGIVGQMKRVETSFLDLKRRRDSHPGIVFTEDVGFMVNTGRAISYHPENIKAYVARFHDCYNRLPQVLDEQKVLPEDKTLFLQMSNWTEPAAAGETVAAE